MQNEITESRIKFTFPQDWIVTEFDKWIFYDKKFKGIFDGIKAVDILAFSPDETLWLIEVKNYQQYPNAELKETKLFNLDQMIAQKVVFTLAALLPAKINACGSENNFAEKVLAAKKLRVVFHLEIEQKVLDPADVYQKLRKKLKAIDVHPIVVDSEKDMPWSVTLT